MNKPKKVSIRSPLPGELGWILQAHGQYYAEKFGWGGDFECIVAKILVEYLSTKNPDKQACFIADDDGRPVGSIMLMENGSSQGKLRVLFVSEDARGKGIARLLVDALLKKAKRIGYQTLNLWTTDKQKEARELYKKVGFSLVSQTPNHSFAEGSYDELWEIKLSGSSPSPI